MGKRFVLGILTVALAMTGCDDGPVEETDAGRPPREDAGPPVPVSTDHCTYEEAPATAGAGGTVEAGTLSAGTADALLDLPLGTAVGSYTSRAESFGFEGFVPAPDDRRTPLANAFAPSVGIETIPHSRALALSAGGETVVIMKVDLSLSYQGFIHAVEANLGPEYAGKVMIAASHSHSSFGNYTGHGGMKVGFSELRREILRRFKLLHLD